MFKLIYQRLGHPGLYRLKGLHLYTYRVEDFNVLKNFQYNTYDQAKIIKIINRES